MRPNIFERIVWRLVVGIIKIGGLAIQLVPTRLPTNQGQKMEEAASNNDILIIFNGGGWGDTPLEQADDFRSILHGINDVLGDFGIKSEVIPYTRTLKGPIGRLSGLKEQQNSFKNNSEILYKDIVSTINKYPSLKILVAGHSTGGGLVSRGMNRMAKLKNVYAITVGTPGWFDNYRSANSLVLNNNFRDPLVSGKIFSVAKAVVLTPFVWIKARTKGEKLSLPLSMIFPNHQYTWESTEVGPPIKSFLFLHFSKKILNTPQTVEEILESVST